MFPRFRDDQLAVPRNANARGKSQSSLDEARSSSSQINSHDASAAAKIQEIAAPLGGRMGARTIANDQRVFIQENSGRWTVELLAGQVRGKSLAVMAATDDRDTKLVQSQGKSPLRGCGQEGDLGIVSASDRGACVVVKFNQPIARREQYLPTRSRQIVRRLYCRDAVDTLQVVVGLERAVHDRNRDGMIAAPTHESVKDTADAARHAHAFAPQ